MWKAEPNSLLSLPLPFPEVNQVSICCWWTVRVFQSFGLRGTQTATFRTTANHSNHSTTVPLIQPHFLFSVSIIYCSKKDYGSFEIVLYMPVGYYTIHPDQWSIIKPHLEDISINCKDIEPLPFNFGLNIFILMLSVQHVLCEQYKVKRMGTEAKCLSSSSPFGLRYCKYEAVALLSFIDGTSYL